MLKLCYKNNDKRTDEYYFDLQSQKVYKICLSTYYVVLCQDLVQVKMRFSSS